MAGVLGYDGGGRDDQQLRHQNRDGDGGGGKEEGDRGLGAIGDDEEDEANHVSARSTL